MKTQRLYLYALDPTHIGAGGYRLGRVDKTILRDAATQLPKIPGTSISGVVRTAAIYSLPEPARQQAIDYARQTLDRPAQVRGGADDPVARYFGFAEGEEGSARIGMVAFRDAHILAFPVPTMVGPRWVTTTHLLAEAGCDGAPEPEDIAAVISPGREGSGPRKLNLGTWLLTAQPGDIPFPPDLEGQPGMDYVKRQLVVVHPDLFPTLVEANLETRTSVNIDFATGTAAEGLLFTYEATPRGTLFRAQVELDDERFPDLCDPALVLLERALPLACQWGLGGMTTRGFGRMRPLLVGE
jgi:CRISPR-associated protein Cmr4